MGVAYDRAGVAGTGRIWKGLAFMATKKLPMVVTEQAAGRQWTVTSERNAAKLYIVRRSEHGLSCDCPASLYRDEACKHVRLVAATLVNQRAAEREAEIAAEEARLAAKKAALENARAEAMFRLTGRRDLPTS
jgi:hypothetical protein